MVIWKLLLDYKRHYFRVYWIYTFTCLLYFLGKKISHFSTHIIQLPCLLLCCFSHFFFFAHTSQDKRQCKKFTIELNKDKNKKKRKCNVFKYIFPCHFTTWAMKTKKKYRISFLPYLCLYMYVHYRCFTYHIHAWSFPTNNLWSCTIFIVNWAYNI